MRKGRAARARGLVALALAGVAAAALAGPQSVMAPDGTRWRLNDDDDPPLLERVSASGALDRSFGRNGRVTLDFGGMDVSVAALRVDTAGRIWLAATTSTNGPTGPMVQRLQPSGQPDGSWGAAGRSIAGPTGQRLMVIDMLPRADGSAWVAGNLLDPQGASDAGLWHLRPDGALDYGFGMGGLWKHTGSEHSRVLSLAEGPDDVVALGIERLSGPHPGREVWVVRPGQRQPEAVAPSADSTGNDDEEDEVYLLWVQGWLWRSGMQTATVSGLPIRSAAAAAPMPPSAPGEAGHIALNPFSEQAPAASAPVPEPTPSDWPWGWSLGGLAGLALLLYVWWRGRGPSDG
jgi:hypothetical protein